MVARGERPSYRVRMAEDDSWIVEGRPWLPIAAASRSEALASARKLVAGWLEVDESAVDIEAT